MSACPDQKRIYGVNIKAEPSTRFADWIETNLLKVEASKIRRIVLRQLQDSGGPQRPGRLVLQRGEKLDDHPEGLFRPVDDGWAPGGRAAQRGQACARLSDALADLKIVGIRPRPAGLERP